MILGLHNFTDAVTHYFHDHVSADGGASILLLDGVLLIPVIFAVFFYPVQVLASLAVVLVLGVAFVTIARRLQKHRTTVGH